jgi:hypothetical protein
LTGDREDEMISTGKRKEFKVKMINEIRDKAIDYFYRVDPNDGERASSISDGLGRVIKLSEKADTWVDEEPGFKGNYFWANVWLIRAERYLEKAEGRTQ